MSGRAGEREKEPFKSQILARYEFQKCEEIPIKSPALPLSRSPALPLNSS
jgi:hypothetical protein